MKKKNLDEETVPRLDLAPRLKRPLSLWNPLDYLRLLYWAFFFPQAIRFHVKKFNRLIDRFKLIFQAFCVVFITTYGICIILEMFNLSIYWSGVITGVIVGLAVGVVIGVLVGTSGRVRRRRLEFTKGEKLVMLTIYMAFLIVSIVLILLKLKIIIVILMKYSLLFIFTVLTVKKRRMIKDGVVVRSESWVKGVALVVVESVVLGVMFGVVGSGLQGMMLLVMLCVILGVSLSLAFGVTLGVILYSSSLGVLGWLLWGAITMALIVGFGGVYSLASISTFIFFMFRLPEYMISTFYLSFTKGEKRINRLPQLSRLVILPIPGVQKCLENLLELEWGVGIQQAHQLLEFSLQSVPVVKAIRQQLYNSTRDTLLPRISAIADKPYDWDLLPALSKKPIQLYNAEKKLTPFLDTSADAACAGFWFWYLKETNKALEMFSRVRDLRYGPEIYQIALAINEGINAKDLKTIASLEKEMNDLNALSDPELRSGTLKALRVLHSAAMEAWTTLHSRSTLNRSTAVNRALGGLIQLIDSGESFCPNPEWPLIRYIADKWKDIFIRAGGIIGEEVLRQPVLNPYEGYSGLPVTGTTFVGRADILEKIENYWTTQGQPGTIILYGHRRMGKTSILRSLANRTGAETLYVYLDMQNVTWVNHTGELLLELAEAIHRAVAGAGPDAGPAPDEASYTDLGTGRRALNALLDHLDTQMTAPKRLVLAIDEFELIETGIAEKRIDAGILPYLRSIVQKYRWLGLIFAGLHTLEEMGRDYQSAFYGQAEYIRVGYLEYSDAEQLIRRPHPDFALEYAPELLAELYALTSGQPFLIQRLCWELVTRWNERFLKQGETTPRILTHDDLAPVLTPDFYQGAGYYFEGVWTKVTENERTLMRHLAAREQGTWDIAELAAAVNEIPSFKESENLEKAIELLKRHDVIAVEKGGIRIASELMRRWIQAKDNSKFLINH